MREMEIIINPDNTIEIDLIGFKGKGCSDISKKIAAALGTVVKTDKKCEYYDQQVKQQQRIHRDS